MPSNIVPSVLHIRLGIVSKIVAAIDAIIDIWNAKNKFSIVEGAESPAAVQLADSLARCGARSE